MFINLLENIAKTDFLVLKEIWIVAGQKTIKSPKEGHKSEKTSINVGVGLSFADIERESVGNFKTIRIKNAAGISLINIDKTGSRSRLGYDGAESATISRLKGGRNLYEGTDHIDLGHIESKGASWSITNPYSFYYTFNEEATFGLNGC